MNIIIETAPNNVADVLLKKDGKLYAFPKSKNVLKAIKEAQNKGLKIIFLTGKNKTNINVDLEINVPSEITCEIQEMHIALGHIICEIIENNLFS